MPGGPSKPRLLLRAVAARISAEVPDLPLLHHQGLSPLPEPLLGLLASISAGRRLRAAAVVD